MLDSRTLLISEGLQQEQPQLYDSLTKNLTPEEQQVVQAAVHQADTIAAELQRNNGHPVRNGGD